jgi:molybdenum cofactor synthesis domain-containing protein
MASRFKYDHPDDALDAIADRLAIVAIDKNAEEIVGRVLAQAVVADRDSPAADVSAMDGYAIRLCDLTRLDAIPVQGESAPGAPPPEMPSDGVVRIFTGAIVPAGCQAVLKREDTEELDGAIRLRESTRATQAGEHIRRAGENAAQGQTVLQMGTRIDAATIATMANFGVYRADVYAPVRVSVITSGNEVGMFRDEPPQPWQLRNSNRQAIHSLLQQRAGIAMQAAVHCRDEAQGLSAALQAQLEQSDAVILTGGVSMGDYDYVPDVVRSVGGEVIFHGLPIRPGKPILAAVTESGKLILGLPGNPVSATVGCHRFGIPLLAKMNGQSDWRPPCPVVRLAGAGDASIPLHWMRLARLTQHGVAQAVISQGSGDLVSLGQSSGYVELPPGASGEGPWPYHAWD